MRPEYSSVLKVYQTEDLLMHTSKVQETIRSDPLQRKVLLYMKIIMA